MGKDWQEVKSGGRTFQAQGIAHAKALGQEHGWHVQKIAKIKRHVVGHAVKYLEPCRREGGRPLLL